KKILIIVCLFLLLALVGGATYAGVQIRAFDQSFSKVYDVPLRPIVRSTDPAVLERGKHIVESIGACAAGDCHGADLGGGKTIEMGPLAIITGPNITSAGALASYSDAEIARVVRHGLKRDGHTVVLMPSQDFTWWPEEDVRALVRYLRAVPPVQRPNGVLEVRALGKLVDRRDQVPLDV